MGLPGRCQARTRPTVTADAKTMTSWRAVLGQVLAGQRVQDERAGEQQEGERGQRDRGHPRGAARARGRRPRAYSVLHPAHVTAGPFRERYDVAAGGFRVLRGGLPRM